MIFLYEKTPYLGYCSSRKSSSARDEEARVWCLAVDETKKMWQGWLDLPEAERLVIERFFGYHHRIVAIEDDLETRNYVELCVRFSSVVYSFSQMFRIKVL